MAKLLYLNGQANTTQGAVEKQEKNRQVTLKRQTKMGARTIWACFTR